jgi:hypothetical protein
MVFRRSRIFIATPQLHACAHGPFLIAPGLVPFSTRNATTVSYLRAFAGIERRTAVGVAALVRDDFHRELLLRIIMIK